jgi:hypothetical protein
MVQPRVTHLTIAQIPRGPNGYLTIGERNNTWPKMLILHHRTVFRLLSVTESDNAPALSRWSIMTKAPLFDIIAERISDNRKPGNPFHVRRFSDRADAERYLDELFLRFKGNKNRDEQGERWSIREAGVVTRYSIGAQTDSSVTPPRIVVVP